MSARLFVAALPPPAVVDALRGAVRPLRLAAPGLRWSPPDQWHVTLAFLGPVPAERRADLDARLARVAVRHGPIPVEAVGGGQFNDRVLWVQVRQAARPGEGVDAREGVDRGEDEAGGAGAGRGRELRGLAAGVRRAAERARATPEADARPLHAHLTLARVPARGRGELAPLVEQLRATVTPLPWTIDRLVLMRSSDGPPGPAPSYDEQAGWPLIGR